MEGAEGLVREMEGRWTRLATAACRSRVRLLGPGLETNVGTLVRVSIFINCFNLFKLAN